MFVVFRSTILYPFLYHKSIHWYSLFDLTHFGLIKAYLGTPVFFSVRELTHFGLVDLLHNGARLPDQVLDRLAHGGLLRFVLRRLGFQLLALSRQCLCLHGQQVHLCLASLAEREREIKASAKK